MTLQIVDAEMRGYRPGSSGVGGESSSFDMAFDSAFGGSQTADYTIEGDRFEGPVTQSRRLDGLVDNGSMQVNNNRGVATGNYGSGAYGDGVYSDAIDIVDGDRLEFWTQLEGESGLSHRWTALVRYDRFELGERERSTAYYTLDDFVFGVLAWREVRDAFEGDPIAQSEADGDDGILNEVLKTEAPAIDRSQIASIQQTTDISWAGAQALDAVAELAQRAEAYIASDRRALVFDRLADLSPSWTLSASDYSSLRNARDTSGLANEVRIDGGEQPAVDAEQTTHSDWTTVTESSRLTHQLRTRKSEVTRVEIWTDPTRQSSGEAVTARLQADGNGAPVAPDSLQADIARRTLASEFLAEGGWTTFLLPDHTLPDRDPWLIIESGGANGQDIGTDGDGVPTYRAYYPFPLNTRVTDSDSVSTYRRREYSESDSGIRTRRETTDRADGVLRRRSQPTSRIEFRAESVRAHDLTPGDLVTVDEPIVKAQGDFIVTETRDTYDPATNRLSTDITARDVATL